MRRRARRRGDGLKAQLVEGLAHLQPQAAQAAGDECDLTGQIESSFKPMVDLACCKRIVSIREAIADQVSRTVPHAAIAAQRLDRGRHHVEQRRG